jgi:hypothetical protein
MVTVKMTDFLTSVKILNELPAEKVTELYKSAKYGWFYRISNHTEAEIAEGKRINPQVVSMPIENFRMIENKPTSEKEKGYTLICFPATNGWMPYMGFMPAFLHEDGYNENLIEVTIKD